MHVTLYSSIGANKTTAVHIHLRAETKPAEHRSALTPTTTAALLKAGHSSVPCNWKLLTARVQSICRTKRPTNL